MLPKLHNFMIFFRTFRFHLIEKLESFESMVLKKISGNNIQEGIII